METTTSLKTFEVTIPEKYADILKKFITSLEGKVKAQKKSGLDEALEDVKAGSAPLPLKAVSDCGLPVYYYVKEGPARITANNTLEFTPIPPRSRFPVKVTVVAWQYGLKGKVQTAEPVERSFYIYK